MRISVTAAFVAVLAASAGCAGSYNVRTMVSPEASLSSLHSFRVLPVPRARDGRAGAGAYDPMVDNSITNRALRTTITRELIDRGYTLSDRSPDFAVAVYASAREKLDVSQWDYGYPYWPRRGWPGMPATHVTQYTEGTVVVDVINPTSHELLWRGSGSARIADDPADQTKELQKVAAAIIQKFPEAARLALTLR